LSALSPVRILWEGLDQLPHTYPRVWCEGPTEDDTRSAFRLHCRTHATTSQDHAAKHLPTLWPLSVPLSAWGKKADSSHVSHRLSTLFSLMSIGVRDLADLRPFRKSRT
jgi:hypothetical protein